MQQIVKTLPKPVIAASDCKVFGAYYGTQLSYGPRMMLMTNQNSDSINFALFDPRVDCMRNQPIFLADKKIRTFGEAIDTLLSLNYLVYQFDDFQEYMEWVANKPVPEAAPKKKKIVSDFRKETKTHYPVQIKAAHYDRKHEVSYYAYRLGKDYQSSLYLTLDGKWINSGTYRGSYDAFYFKTQSDIVILLSKLEKE